MSGALTGRKMILFGAGGVGRTAFDFFGAEKVFCFADNYRSGQEFCGKSIISFEDLLAIHMEYDVVIAVGDYRTKQLLEQCRQNGVNCFLFGDVVSYLDYESDPAIKQFQDKHKGKRCFLIGNGPSLSADDLSLLRTKGEITFACNYIHKIFYQTMWRPDYYIVLDAYLPKLQTQMLADTEAKYKFISKTSVTDDDEVQKIKETLINGKGQVLFYQPMFYCGRNEELVLSPDASRAVAASITVLLVMINLAVYMGFSEIFLLGVDGVSVDKQLLTENGEVKWHFYNPNEVSDYSKSLAKMRPEYTEELIIANMIAANNLYARLNDHTRGFGVIIYNATRGGFSEGFERKDFDSLFSNREDGVINE